MDITQLRTSPPREGPFSFHNNSLVWWTGAAGNGSLTARPTESDPFAGAPKALTISRIRTLPYPAYC
jgi:hypothetical protein